jgi:hypothetical protein
LSLYYEGSKDLKAQRVRERRKRLNDVTFFHMSTIPE